MGNPNNPRLCRHTNCTDQVVSGNPYFCGRHITAKHRCRRFQDSEDRAQCKKAAMVGHIFCKTHGGGKGTEVSKQAKVLTVMQKFVTPYEGDLDPMGAFEMEYRRTLGRIAWYDAQLAALPSADDLIWGKTKEETAEILAGPDPGTNTTNTYEARANILLVLQWKEREHLLAMSKVWISAGLEEKKLSLMRDYVDAAYTGVVKALEILGLDATDEKVQQALQSALLGDEPPPPLAIEALGSTP